MSSIAGYQEERYSYLFILRKEGIEPKGKLPGAYWGVSIKILKFLIEARVIG